ncbi:DNA-binding response regulator [Taibaiella sp. KBW10]|nr:DNA-binding response regulator [Taibaiella sp. KBW10]
MAKIIVDMLHLKGFEVLHLENGKDILEILKKFKPDLCIFDVMLPHIDGFSVAHRVRSVNTTIPIIFLTAKGLTQDVIDGFNAGANDYIKKPFSIDELLIRIAHQLKQSEQAASAAPAADRILGDCIFSSQQYTLQVGDSIFSLSQREVEVMSLLFQRPEEIINRKQLLLSVWGDDSFYNSRNLDVYIRKIRTYFQASARISLITLKSVGFKVILK